MNIAKERKVQGKELAIWLYVYFDTFIWPCVCMCSPLGHTTNYKVGTSLGTAPPATCHPKTQQIFHSLYDGMVDVH